MHSSSPNTCGTHPHFAHVHWIFCLPPKKSNLQRQLQQTRYSSGTCTKGYFQRLDAFPCTQTIIIVHKTDERIRYCCTTRTGAYDTIRTDV